MSWDWFVPTQTINYPKIIFPNNVYHPIYGFNIKQFIDQNIKYHPMFICGDWKSGDESYQLC